MPLLLVVFFVQWFFFFLGKCVVVAAAADAPKKPAAFGGGRAREEEMHALGNLVGKVPGECRGEGKKRIWRRLRKRRDEFRGRPQYRAPEANFSLCT